jgi:hypothetical protein
VTQASRLGPYFGSSGLVTHIAVVIVAGVPWVACLNALLADGSGQWPFFVVLSVALVIVSRIRNREYWSLSPDRQRRLRDVSTIGIPTGDIELDRMARRRFLRAAEMYPSGQAFIGLVLIAALAVPVIAAIEVQPLWILADIPTAVIAVKLFPLLARDPRRLLMRLDETSGGRSL